MQLSRLTLKQLYAIAAVYRTGKVSAAAEQLFITQSAVSVLIRQAEGALGLALFDRTTRSLVPTAATEEAIGVIERILGDLDALSLTMGELRELRRGQVRLTATPATAQAFLPRTVERFRAAYPAIGLVLDDCAPNQFLPNIRQERAEFGVGMPPPDRGEFDWSLLHDDPLCLICPADHAFGGRTAVAWAELRDVPLLLSRRDYGVRTIVEETLLQQGIRPTLGAEIGFLGSAFWMASAGIGLSILPQRLTRAFIGGDLVSVPLTGPVRTRPIGIVTRRGRSLSPSSRSFVDMLMEEQGQP
ncbi:LysR family transcriptional regulator [Psychromarinibacter sp. C21-152]|uniref:LysR family transcriptional regulator n=1 Tax=Psychromarinibacter sediminicola TaxID=3033385 RepID=A0AAE3T9P1_9RHOB|nr:LysR family transcriptional regulator [Psychromarinibacter sediminicola]MDF0602003.1 LysR family transcriptional regulator [Psychromarinibacter sediminicola]